MKEKLKHRVLANRLLETDSDIVAGEDLRERLHAFLSDKWIK